MGRYVIESRLGRGGLASNMAIVLGQRPVILATIDSGARPENEIVVIVESTDDAGKRAVEERRFFIDRGPPAIEVVKPTANAVLGGDVPIEANAFDSSLIGLTVTAPAGVVDLDPGTPSHVLASVPRGVLADGPHTVTFLAVDAAGNSTVESVDIVTDTEAPKLTVSSPSASASANLTASPSLTVTGSATDTVSDVASIEVRVNGVATAATLGGQPKNRTFIANVTLTASSCATTPWNGTNLIEVRAFDLAGNVSAVQTRTVVYDNCLPSVVVVPTQIDDERDYAAGFLDTTIAPCLFRRQVGAAKTTLTYDVNAAAEPPPAVTTWKFVVNSGDGPYQAQCANGPWQLPGGQPPSGTEPVLDGNPLRWRLSVTDNIGVKSVSYRIKPPTGAFGPSLTATPVSGVPGVTHEVRLSAGPLEDAGVPPGGTAPLLTSGLGEGVWQIEVMATDSAGSVRKPWTIKWEHRPLSGPLFVEQLPIDDVHPLPTGSGYIRLLKTALGLDKTGGGSVAAIYSPGASGNVIFLERYRVSNGTRFEARVVVGGAATGTWQRTINERNPKASLRGGHGPKCASGAFAIATSTCLSAKPVDGASSATGTLSSFVKRLQVWDGNIEVAIAEGADPTLEWTIPAAAPGIPHKQFVHVLASKLSVLWDGGSPAADMVPNVDGPNDPPLFGTIGASWGENFSVVNNDGPKPTVSPLTQINLPIRYLAFFKLVVTGSASFRSRPRDATQPAEPIRSMPSGFPGAPPLSFSLTYDTQENAAVPGYQAP